jgi:DNA-binding IscR family transcriptional regulator
VLVKDPARISVLEIIEAIEGKIVFQRCKQLKPDCEHTDGCALCGLFEKAQDGLKDVLMHTTLVDLIRQQEAIQLARGQKSHAN